MAQKKRKKKISLFMRIYRVLVLLSVLVIVVSVAWHFAVPPPAVAEYIPASLVVEEGEEISQATSHIQRKKGYYTFLLVGSDDGHGNADTIMVVGFDTKGGVLNLVSVPRDTLVERSWSKFPKINAAFSKGVETLQEEVTHTLGIPLDFTVVIGLEAFVDVVDALGGIDYHVPQDMYHDDEGGFVIDLKEGTQHLDGRHTLELVRYRGYATADIGRTQTQQEVIRLLLGKLISWNSLGKIEEFLSIYQDRVDTTLATSDILWFAKAVLTSPNLEIATHTLEGRGDVNYNGYAWCYQLDREKTLEVVNTMLSPYEQPRTPEDLHILTPG